jgi:transporter family-2 protein
MSGTFWFALLSIMAGGAAIAVQAPINAKLASFVGDSFATAAISFGVGFLILAAISVARGAVPSLASLSGVPWWAWIGGALGTIYVASALWAVHVLGVVTMVAALILGQLLAALALDATGAFGLAVREISMTRIGAVALVAAGLVLSRV